MANIWTSGLREYLFDLVVVESFDNFIDPQQESEEVAGARVRLEEASNAAELKTVGRRGTNDL